MHKTTRHLGVAPGISPEYDLPVLHVGSAGSNHIVDVPPVAHADGSIGYNVGELITALETVDPRATVWLAPRTPQETTEGQRRIYAGGRIVLDAALRQFAVDGEHRNLRHREFELIEFMSRNRGHVLKRAYLFQEVWRDKAIGKSLRTVDVHVSRIRKHIGPELAGTIETVRGTGYLFDDRDFLPDQE